MEEVLFSYTTVTVSQTLSSTPMLNTLKNLMAEKACGIALEFEDVKKFGTT